MLSHLQSVYIQTHSTIAVIHQMYHQAVLATTRYQIAWSTYVQIFTIGYNLQSYRKQHSSILEYKMIKKPNNNSNNDNKNNNKVKKKKKVQLVHYGQMCVVMAKWIKSWLIDSLFLSSTLSLKETHTRRCTHTHTHTHTYTQSGKAEIQKARVPGRRLSKQSCSQIYFRLTTFDSSRFSAEGQPQSSFWLFCCRIICEFPCLCLFNRLLLKNKPVFHAKNYLDNFLLFTLVFLSYFFLTGLFLARQLFMKVSFSPDVILCDWLDLKHQLTN